MNSLNSLLIKRFKDERPGLELLGVEKAAVPVTIIAADILAQEVKPLPLLDEFVLRLINAHVRVAPEIASYLGLDQRLVDSSVADHYREGMLTFGPGLGQLTLTERGRRLSDELAAVKPVRKTVKIAFDRLTWSVTDYESRDLITKAAATADGYLLLPARQTTRIKPEDIPVNAVNSFLSQPGRGASLDVLEVLHVVPSTHRYMAVDMLIYGDGDLGEVELAVIVDGDQSDKHDSGLGELGGALKLGITVEPERQPTVLAGAAEFSLSDLQTESESPSRSISLFEHYAIQEDALQSASDRILIVTEVANSSVVDSSFLFELDRRLRRGVVVDLAYVQSDSVVEKSLVTLLQKYRKRFNVHRCTSLTENAMIFDSNWVVSDFPWLSYRGSTRPFRKYSGTVVTDASTVDRRYSEIRDRIRAGR